MNISSSDIRPAVAGRALRGHLHLRADLRADGTPYLSRQDFRTPVHLGKPHLSHGSLVVQMVNPTAGLFDGDEVSSSVEVGPGARLVLSAPSSARVFRTRTGAPARSIQNWSVAEGGSLEWIPEPFIPHAGAACHQRTVLRLAEGADLLHFDWLAPGRVAMGEVFAYQSLRWEFDLIRAGVLAARERYTLRPDDDSLAGLRTLSDAAHVLTVYAAGAFARDWPAEEIDALSGDSCYLGHGPLHGGVLWIRAICRDALATRRLLDRLRPLLHRAAGRPVPALGRIFC